MTKTKKLCCSFCGRKKEDTLLLIAGSDGSYICDKCIVQANQVLQEELFLNEDKEDIKEDFKLLKPKEIKKFLDEYIIGQDQAKKVISVAVYNHYKRINNSNQGDVELEKSNILMIGKTGTGKTLIARTIARILRVPFCIVDATVFTEAGYVGEDVESILSRLLQAANYNSSLAERGIVYVDEIDKVARKSDNPSLTRDVSGEGVQQALLKLLEGSEVLVPPQGGRKHPEQQMVKINTQNILFVCGGAFDHLERIIQKRMKTSDIGFGSIKRRKDIDEENVLKYITPHDLKTFGLIPELIGRIPMVTYLEPLDKNALSRILVQPKNALIKQYKLLFDLEGIDLKFEPAVYDYIVQKALENDLGARGLRGICEHIMTDAMFELPSEQDIQTFTVSLEYAKEKVEKLDFTRLKVA